MFAPQSSVVYMSAQDAAQVRLDALHVPFSLDVLGDGRDGGSSAAEAAPGAVVRCELKTETSCRVRLLWRVPFSALTHLLNQITAADALLYSCQNLSYDPGRYTVEAADSGAAPQEGTPPRNHYPLIVVVETTSAPDSSSAVVALLVVIHVRDAAAPMPTAALHRYVRQADGRVTLLQPLYSSGVEGEQQQQQQADAVDSEEEVRPGAEDVCCVCRDAPAVVVLLPCRHGCVCRHCFTRTDSCPLCRARVAQYFIKPPPATGQQRQQQQQRQRQEGRDGVASHSPCRHRVNTAPAGTE